MRNEEMELLRVQVTEMLNARVQVEGNYFGFILVLAKNDDEEKKINLYTASNMPNDTIKLVLNEYADKLAKSEINAMPLTRLQ